MCQTLGLLGVCQSVGPGCKLSSTLPLTLLSALSRNICKGLVPVGQNTWKQLKMSPYPQPRYHCGFPVPVTQLLGAWAFTEGPSVWSSEVDRPDHQLGDPSPRLQITSSWWNPPGSSKAGFSSFLWPVAETSPLSAQKLMILHSSIASKSVFPFATLRLRTLSLFISRTGFLPLNFSVAKTGDQMPASSS